MNPPSGLRPSGSRPIPCITDCPSVRRGPRPRGAGPDETQPPFHSEVQHPMWVNPG